MAGLRVIFMGTPDFALEALKAIDESEHEVIAVYSQPPRPKGRGKKVQPSPTHQYAETHSIPVLTPKSLKNLESQAEFSALQADVAVVAAYGLILPKAVLDAPKYGCLNIHGSLLPRWRGASPIQRAIWEGDKTSGITIMQMDEGLDTGPEALKRAINLAPDETASSLHDRLAKLGDEMILEALDLLAINGQMPVNEQENEGVTYAHLLKKEDGKINWTESADKIDRQIRALNPWPGTFCERFKIKDAGLSEQTTDQLVGTVLDQDGRIACGGGSVLQILKIQPAGKQAMDFRSAVNGGYVSVGERLSS